MNEIQRALTCLLAHVPALLLAGACSGDVTEQDTNPQEVARLAQHFAAVRGELLAADFGRLDAEQRDKRAQHVARLAKYAAGGVFPHNHDRAERTPFFIDRHGTRCAMAYLIEQSGRGDLVARIAREDNEAYIAELAGDPELIAWLGENGLTAAEAARIQPAYDDMPPIPQPGLEESGYGASEAIGAAVAVTSGALLVLNLGSSEKNTTRGYLGVFSGALGVTLGLLSTDEEERGIRALGGINIGVGLVGIAVGLDVISGARTAPPVAGTQTSRHVARQDRGVELRPLLSGDSVGLAMGGSF
jgi:hypothetical protein